MRVGIGRWEYKGKAMRMRIYKNGDRMMGMPFLRG